MTGISESGRGVAGKSNLGDGVIGEGSIGVRGLGSDIGAVAQGGRQGVYAIGGGLSNISVGNAAVTGDSNDRMRLLGLSGTSNAVVGRSGSGRGGVFYGPRASVQLLPSPVGAPPTDGETGDLMVDSTGRLWFCKLGGSTTTWVKLA